jgi:Putative MetA-pathway of phenol degradation
LTYYHATGAVNNAVVGHATENSDLGYDSLTYAFKTPVLGGQLALSMVGAIGGLKATAGTIEDSRFGYNDLLPTAILRWNAGVHNYMVYGQGEIPVGTYDPSRLANFGIGHGGVDSGAGYTYFNIKTGYEFSAVAGLTYNLVNTDTDYQNGIDAHIDWGGAETPNAASASRTRVPMFLAPFGLPMRYLVPEKCVRATNRVRAIESRSCGGLDRGRRDRHPDPTALATRLVATAANDGSDGEQQPNALPCWPLQKCGSANASSMGRGSADTGRPLDRIWSCPKCGNSRS